MAICEEYTAANCLMAAFFSPLFHNRKPFSNMLMEVVGSAIKAVAICIIALLLRMLALLERVESYTCVLTIISVNRRPAIFRNSSELVARFRCLAAVSFFTANHSLAQAHSSTLAGALEARSSNRSITVFSPLM